MTEQPIIAGAGPVGLAAGVFLARHGIMARVIDCEAGPAVWSKALAVSIHRWARAE